MLVHRGVHHASLGIEETLLPRAREIGDGQVVVPAFRVAVIVRSESGDVSGAVALVEELDELARGRTGVRSWLLSGASRACLGAGASELLRSMIDQGTEHLLRDANCVVSARAVLAEIEGAHDQAVEGYDDAAARWASFPSILEHGHALSGTGRCLLALGRPFDAAERLTRARSAYALLEATPLVAEVDALLAEATAKTS